MYIRLRLITLTSTFIILDITKAPSNNCLIKYIYVICRQGWEVSIVNNCELTITRGKFKNAKAL